MGLFGRGEPDTKWVVFVDALTERDLPGNSYLSQSHQSTVDAGVPRVTPRVTGSFWTGDDPAVHGMPSMSRYGQPSRQRPATETVMEQVAQQTDMDVLSLSLPFTPGLEMPWDPQQGQRNAFFGAGMGQPQGSPEDLIGQMQVAGPARDLIGDAPEDTYSSIADHTHTLFETARSLQAAHDFDVVFIGHRTIDSYCHFQYDRPRGSDTTWYRDRLAKRVSSELELLSEQGDVLWFSDHGATQLDETFRINQWLADKGYLSYEFDERGYQREAAQQAANQGHLHSKPNGRRVENQITAQQGWAYDFATHNETPPITVSDDSDIICGDPFDCGLTALHEDAPLDEIAEELLDTGKFRSVQHRDDVFDPNGPLIHECPDLLPDREEGVFVSGNLHPESVGMGYYREGVHHRHGVAGGDMELDADVFIPEQIYDVICEFLDFSPEDTGNEYANMGRQQLLQQKRIHEQQARQIDNQLRGNV